MKVMNPVLPGFNPDPSPVRVGDDYYIATSTFEWFPGICIHHSKDLVNWEILSYALTDETKFDIKGMDTACGIWAPNLTYDNGTFYLIHTIVYTNRNRFKDTHNFMVTASDPKGPWSDPIPLIKWDLTLLSSMIRTVPSGWSICFLTIGWIINVSVV